MKTFGESAYVAFVVALVATASFGVQTLIETKPAIAGAKPITPLRPAKIAVKEEPTKRELSPLFPVNPSRGFSNAPQKAVESKPMKPRGFAAKPSARARKSSTQIAAFPKSTLSNSYAQESPPVQDDIFGFLSPARR